jgi:hypothetical protein
MTGQTGFSRVQYEDVQTLNLTIDRFSHVSNNAQ